VEKDSREEGERGMKERGEKIGNGQKERD